MQDHKIDSVDDVLEALAESVLCPFYAPGRWCGRLLQIVRQDRRSTRKKIRLAFLNFPVDKSTDAGVR